MTILARSCAYERTGSQFHLAVLLLVVGLVMYIVHLSPDLRLRAPLICGVPDDRDLRLGRFRLRLYFHIRGTLLDKPILSSSQFSVLFTRLAP